MNTQFQKKIIRGVRRAKASFCLYADKYRYKRIWGMFYPNKTTQWNAIVRLLRSAINRDIIDRFNNTARYSGCK